MIWATILVNEQSEPHRILEMEGGGATHILLCFIVSIS